MKHTFSSFHCRFTGTLVFLIALMPVTGRIFAQPLVKDNSVASEWVTNVSAGNEISAEGNTLKITALNNSYALVRKPFSGQDVLVSAEFKSGGGSFWAPGICLYWDQDNWIKFMQFDNKGYFAVEVINGEYAVFNLSNYQFNEYNSLKHSDLWVYDEDQGNLKLANKPIDTRSWMYLGFGIKDNIIYYLSGQDGEKWTTQRLGQRRGKMLAQPSMIIMGKGHARPKMFPEAFLNNDDKDKGETNISYIRNFRIEKGFSRNKEKNVQISNYGADTLGLRELSASSDPSFESVSQHFPAMKYQREAIGVKNHTYEFSTYPDGALRSKEGISYFLVNGKRFGREPDFPRKELYKGYLPTIISHWNYDGLEMEQTQFGWSKGMSVDTDLVGFVSLKIVNREGRERKVQLSYFGTDIKPWEIVLPAGASKTVYVQVPYLQKRTSALIEKDAFESAMNESTHTWETILNQGMKIVTPEKRVNNAYRAWLAYNFLNVDKTNAGYEMRDGNHFYEELYGYTACLSIQAFDWMGHKEDAEKYLETLLKVIDKDGLFTINYGLPDQGAILIAITDHYKMTGNKEWLRKVHPDIVRLCKWVVNKRIEEKKKQDPKSAFYGLIKFVPYCDNPIPSYFYGSDATVTAGMEAISKVLPDIGMNADAQWISAEASDYRKCIETSMSRSVITHDGMKKLPLFPETHQLLRAANYNAYDYYSLLAGPLMEVNAIDVNSPYMKMITELMEKKGGLLLGVCRFWGGIDHAYTYGYWMNCMNRNEIGKVILGFYTSLAYGMTRDTYSAVEVTFIEEGKNFYTLPHSYSNTEQLKILRNMLLREDGQVLRIAQAIPKPWLKDGEKIIVKDAPTLFGNISYEIKSNIASGGIHVDITPGREKKPESVVVYLRHPDDKPIKAVKIKSEENKTFERDHVVSFGNGNIVLRNVTEPISVEVSY